MRDDRLVDKEGLVSCIFTDDGGDEGLRITTICQHEERGVFFEGRSKKGPLGLTKSLVSS